MTQLDSPELVPALEKVKAEMMKSSHQHGNAGRWDDAQSRLQMARDLDNMLHAVKGNGYVPSARPTPQAAQMQMRARRSFRISSSTTISWRKSAPAGTARPTSIA